MKRQLATLFFGILFLSLNMACTPTSAPVADVATVDANRPTVTATTNAAEDVPTAVPPTVTPLPTATTAPTEVATVISSAQPHILSRTPRETTIADLHPLIRVDFDQPMDGDSVADALTISPDVPLQLRWEGNTLLIEPESALLPGTTYRFALDDTAVSQSSAPLNRSYAWQYHLPLLVTTAGNPTITSAGMELTLHFNYPINPQTISVRFEPALDIRQSWHKAEQELIISSTTVPAAGQSYTLHFEGEWQDENGELLPLPLPQTVNMPQAIARVFPEDGGMVNPATAVSLQFNRPMNQEITRAAFSIEPRVPGTLEWHDNLLELHSITDRLLPNTTYVVTLDATAVDSSGTPILSEPYTWSFSTGDLQSLSNFGDGSHVQILAKNGPQTVQFTAFQDAPEEVNFDLYRVNLSGWLDGSAWEGGELLQSWAETTTSHRDWYATPQQTALSALPLGIYRLELRTGNYVEDRLILFVSDYLLTVKEDTDELLIWLTNSSGTAVADADVTIYQEAAVLANGRTAADGTLRLPVTLQPDKPYKVVAGQGEDVVVLALSSEYGSGSRARSSAHYQIATITDRPVYYPGDELFFRAILRWSEDATPQLLPTDTAVTVALQAFNQDDWSWQEVQSQQVSTSHFGTANGRFLLPTTPGKYQLVTSIEDKQVSTAFTVQPRSDAPFTVAVTTDAPIYAEGTDMTVIIDVLDANGQPVSEANVQIDLLESGNSGCFGTPSGGDSWYSSYQDALHRRTDENGRATLTLPAELGYFTHSDDRNSKVQHGLWAIKATVSHDGQSAGGFAIAEVANVAQIATVQVNGHLQTPGVAFPVTAVLTDLMGNPQPNHSLSLAVLAYSGQADEYAVQHQLLALQTDADGRASTSLTISQPGQYRLRLWRPDGFGHTAEAETMVVVYDEAVAPPSNARFGSDQFRISTDQDAHTIGQTARLLVHSSFSGSALLTVARGTLSRYQVVQLTAPLTVLQLPLSDTDAPNIHVTLNAWQPQTQSFTADANREVTWQSLPDYVLQTATLNLTVSNPAYVTNMVIETDKAAYAPGETAEITVRVTNGRGEGVSAEVGFALVDAAIYAHHSPHTSSLSSIFHNNGGNVVLSYDAMRPLRYLYGDNFGGCGCGGWWDEPGDPVNEFNNSVFWLPSIVTDHNGEARLTITLPADAGLWRLSAYGVTADTQVGETAVTITSSR